MNAPNLSRRIASRIVEGLKGRGRILVVKGGTAALVRVLDDAMTSIVEPLAAKLAKHPTLTADPATNAALAELTSRVSQALLASEHLEDVFADRNIVEREVLDAARATLQEACAERDEAVVRVELDLLGYVATTLGKRADPNTLVEALIRAGRAAGAELGTYDPATRQATFLPRPPAHPDLRLELEEAVDDELSALVEEGAVTLPTLERTAALTRDVSPSERARLARAIDRLATRTLRRTGNAAHWEIPDGRSVRVVFTPLSEQDARDVDTHVLAFAQEIDALLAEAGAPLASTEAPSQAPTAEAPEARPEPEPAPQAPLEAEETPAEKKKRARGEPKRAPRSSQRTPAPRATTKKRSTTTKRAASTTEEPARKKTSSSAAKRARPTTTKKRPTKKR